MAVTDTDSLVGELELVTRPQNLCWGKPLDFVKTLIDIVKVKFPISRGNKFVVVGHETPGTDDVDKQWARFDQNRNPLGWHAFVKGQWRKYYTVVPGEIRWIIGDSDNPPSGWQLVDENISGLNINIVNKLKAQYVAFEGDPTRFMYFAVRYFGY